MSPRFFLQNFPMFTLPPCFCGATRNFDRIKSSLYPLLSAHFHADFDRYAMFHVSGLRINVDWTATTPCWAQNEFGRFSDGSQSWKFRSCRTHHRPCSTTTETCWNSPNGPRWIHPQTENIHMRAIFRLWIFHFYYAVIFSSTEAQNKFKSSNFKGLVPITIGILIFGFRINPTTSRATWRK